MAEDKRLDYNIPRITPEQAAAARRLITRNTTPEDRTEILSMIGIR